MVNNVFWLMSSSAIKNLLNRISRALLSAIMPLYSAFHRKTIRMRFKVLLSIRDSSVSDMLAFTLALYIAS